MDTAVNGEKVLAAIQHWTAGSPDRTVTSPSDGRIAITACA
jgi:hypothetical protein